MKDRCASVKFLPLDHMRVSTGDDGGPACDQPAGPAALIFVYLCVIFITSMDENDDLLTLGAGFPEFLIQKCGMLREHADSRCMGSGCSIADMADAEKSQGMAGVCQPERRAGLGFVCSGPDDRDAPGAQGVDPFKQAFLASVEGVVVRERNGGDLPFFEKRKPVRRETEVVSRLPMGFEKRGNAFKIGEKEVTADVGDPRDFDTFLTCQNNVSGECDAAGCR